MERNDNHKIGAEVAGAIARTFKSDNYVKYSESRRTFFRRMELVGKKDFAWYKEVSDASDFYVNVASTVESNIGLSFADYTTSDIKDMHYMSKLYFDAHHLGITDEESTYVNINDPYMLINTSSGIYAIRMFNNEKKAIYATYTKCNDLNNMFFNYIIDAPVGEIVQKITTIFKNTTPKNSYLIKDDVVEKFCGITEQLCDYDRVITEDELDDEFREIEHAFEPDVDDDEDAFVHAFIED